MRPPVKLIALGMAVAMLPLMSAPAGAEADLVPCDQRPPTFRPYIRLGDGFGYEPGIETDSLGTIYVMAHKRSLVAEGSGTNTRTASWLWRSIDGGLTFQDMAGLSGATNLAYALEGDGAVDARDRFYYVDTWAADNHFSRWSARGATLDMWRPLVPSFEPVDDRPWVAAHGDGYVYYFGNLGVGSPARDRLFVHRSTDAGETFDPEGFSFANSLWGFLDADPNSPYVYAFMDETNTDQVVTWVSPDLGQSWTRHPVASVDPEGAASEVGFPSIAVSPVDGTVYTAWDDVDQIYLGESRDHGQTWTVHDITPFPGHFAHPWPTVGPTGDVGLVFDADPEGVGGGNFVYGMIWRPASGCLSVPADPASACTGPSEIYARLQEASVPAQEDFIQTEFLLDGRLAAPYESTEGHIRFTVQETGPNIDGTPSCGIVGTP
ncbi:MAG: hypothetical protein ACRDHC_09010 [Actinomycetota bacterium]